MRTWAGAALPAASSVLVGWIVAVWLGKLPGVAAGLAWTGLLVLWGRSQGRRACSVLGARPADPVGEARLFNIVEGLAARRGGPTPRVLVIESQDANALTTRWGGIPTVALTTSLLDGCVRTEIEAVVAHCLVRSDPSSTTRASLGCAFGPILQDVAPLVGDEDDVSAAALTRYPPALSSVLAKLDPSRDRFAPLWMASTARSHRALDERIALVDDL